MSLQSTFQPRHNSLNALRLLLAWLVIVSHSTALGGYGDELRVGGETLGGWAVFGFFGISGYLITRSRMGARRVSDYYRARALRIFPGYIVCLLVVAFAIAPLSYLFGSTGRYELLDAVTWALRNLPLYLPFINQPGISDTLADGLVFPNTWNGALWTIGYEFFCYFAIGVLVSVAKKTHLGAILVVCFCAMTAVRLLAGWHVIAVPQMLAGALPLGISFSAGALLFIYAQRVRLNNYTVAIAFGLLLAVILAGAATSLAHLPFAYLMLWLGQRLPLQTVGSRYDISYGVYIYAWPVQQCLALAFPGQALPYWAFVAVTTVLVIPFAWASCKFIEQPALRLKARQAAAEALQGGQDRLATPPVR
ncbi:acyltransferase [Pseudarthrobacter sp. BRE9]|uniref:acyltransferase family protein n=1 Tax=Pseudarthrobacter sp. BRE9 TaxID=2962582 RepID=UPI0028818B70|nr:acyltransferase [Pseudarthrobacter sp. BRE9]MDT0168966.1 acyltransferase [Pseudarthrobacter sp. BRE9]